MRALRATSEIVLVLAFLAGCRRGQEDRHRFDVLVHPLAEQVVHRREGAKQRWQFVVAAGFGRVARYYDGVLRGPWKVLGRSVEPGRAWWLAGRGRQRLRIEAVRQEAGRTRVVVVEYLAEGVPAGAGRVLDARNGPIGDAGASASAPSRPAPRPRQRPTPAPGTLPAEFRLPNGWQRTARSGILEYRHPSRNAKALAKALVSSFRRAGWSVEGSDLGEGPLLLVLSRGSRMVVVRLDASSQGTKLRVISASNQ